MTKSECLTKLTLQQHFFIVDHFFCPFFEKLPHIYSDSSQMGAKHSSEYQRYILRVGGIVCREAGHDMARPITAWISVDIGCPGRSVKLGCGGGYLVSHPLVGWGARCLRPKLSAASAICENEFAEKVSMG